MKVLVLGASGFVGSAVASAFVRAGHIVYGQTRSKDTGERMAAQEIFPVVCDPFSEGDIWAKVAKDVDVLIDALASLDLAHAQRILKTFLKSISHRSSCPVLPTYIYCSGHYVMARGLEWTDERQPALAPCNHGSAWRRDIEDAVLTSKRVNGVVIRPVCLYGKGMSYFGAYHFAPALEALRKGKKRFESIVSIGHGRSDDGEATGNGTETEGERGGGCGNGGGKIATIHCDDCAELFVAVAERSPTCRGQVFVASNPSTDNIRDILDGIVRITGLEGWDAREPRGESERAWVTPVLQKSTLGHALTGWAPRRMGVSDGIEVYWSSYVHNQPKEQLKVQAEQAEGEWVML